MSKDSDILERIAILETRAAASEEKLKTVMAKVSYYDKMAIKWGGVCIGILVCAAFLGGKMDKVKDKLIQWLL